MNGYVSQFRAPIDTMSDEEAISKIKALGYAYSEQQEVILHTRGGMAICACAGSGKTHTLVGLITKRVLTGEIASPSNCLLTTFSRAGEENMSERLNTMMNSLGLSTGKRTGVQVRTMHSVYSQFITQCNGVKPNVILDGQKLSYIQKAAKDSHYWGKSLSEEELNSLTSLLTYQINSLMPIADLYKSYLFDMEMSLEAFQDIHRLFYEYKSIDKVLDFDDLQYQVYWALYESDPRNRQYFYNLLSNYQDLYVDEFQDTSLVQYRILQALIKDPNKFVVCGDDDQCIYGWRGSIPRLLLNITADYTCMQKRYLETNYRTAENVLVLPRNGVKYITEREPKRILSNNSGGKIDFVMAPCNDLYETAKRTADDIVAQMASGVKGEDIVILCRQNAVLHTLIMELVDRNLWLMAETKVSNNIFFKDVEVLYAMAVNSGSANMEAKSVLWKLIKFFGYKNADTVARIMQTTGLDLIGVLGIILARRGFLSKDWAVPIENKRVEASINSMSDSMSIDSLSSMHTLHEILMTEDKNEKMKRLLAIYYAGIEFMSKRPNKIRQTKGMYRFFYTKLSEKGIEWLGQFILLLKSAETLGQAQLPNKLTLSTIHGVKGLEWEHVYLYCFDNYCFPNCNYVKEKGSVVTTDLTGYLNEERRLAYVACTRAKTHLHLVTGTDAMSYLLLEQLELFWQKIGKQSTQGFIEYCDYFDTCGRNPEFLTYNHSDVSMALDALYSPNNIQKQDN